VSLRLRLFLLVAGLVSLLVVGQIALVRALEARIDADVTAVAVQVGQDLLSGFAFEREGDGNRQVTRGMVWLQERRPSGQGATEAAPEIEGDAIAPDGVAPRSRFEWRIEENLQFRGRPTPEQLEEAGRLFGRSIVRRELFPLQLPPGSDSAVSLLPDGSGHVVVYNGANPAAKIRVPAQRVTSSVDRFGSQIVAGTLALFVLGLVAAAVLAHRTTRPLEALAGAARRVGAGELGVAVENRRRDEIGEAITAFNAMSARLAELDRENRRLSESQHLSELAEVARGFAHTLRNPLNTLGLAIERLAGESDPERADELSDRCRRQIRRIDGGLRSFLALASAPAAQAEPIDLAALAREVALEALQDAAGRVGIEVEADGPVPIRAVAAEVKAVLQALVVNAGEASPDGARVVVRIAAADRGRARVEVVDEGAGIAPEVAERLFSPHVTTKPHGSGMGLYLVERLVTSRYDGSVRLEPREPHGTQATVELADRREENG